MALSRSASGPGGLSINTSSANMFGSASSQPSAPGGLFGSASTPKPGGLFGNTSSAATTNTNTTSQPQQTSSLFGGTSTTATGLPQPTATPQPQPTAGGLFGTPAATTQPQQPAAGGGAGAGGLFGGASTATPSQPQQTGGLFGNAPQNQSQPQNQTQSTGGLFGQIGTATPGGGLFGNPSNLSQPNSTGGTGFLGQQSQQKPGLFGGLGQQSQANTLGQSQQQQPAMGLGGSFGIGLTMGQSSSAQTVPGVRINIENVKGTTRFNDLQEELQKLVEQFDFFIQAQMAREQEIESMMPGHGEMLESIPNDVNFVARKYDGARNSLESAAQAIDSARVLVNQDADHARLCFRAIDNLKLPQQYHTSGFWSPRQQAPGTANTESDGQDLVGFFSKTADDMAEQMNKYGRNLTDIETHMHAVNDSLGDQLQRMMAIRNGTLSGPDEKIQELVAVLRDFEQGILKVAGDVGSAREGMTRLQLGEFMGNDGYRNGVY